MKRLLLTLVVALSAIWAAMGQAPSYYRLIYNGGGQGEYIANTSINLQFTGCGFYSDYKLRSFMNADGSWCFLNPNDTDRGNNRINLLNDAVKALPDIGISTTGNTQFNKLILANINNYTGMHGFIGYGRNDDMVIESSRSNKFLRIASKGSIAFWAGMTSDTNDIPLVELQEGKSIFRNQVVFNSGNTIDLLTLKNGRFGDATISTVNNKMLRFGGGSFGFWTDGNTDENDSPQFKVSATNVSSSLPIDVTTGGVRTVMRKHPDRNVAWLGTTSSNDLEIGVSNNTVGVIGTDGNLYWGFNGLQTGSSIRAELRSKYSMFVKKGILAADYAIAPVSSWADYVFEDSYRLRPLSEVKKYVDDNGHLPDVPSAAQVATEGYSQHDMNETLLRKVEELTLYILQQQKEIDELRSRLGE